jgi:hypothetical protein
MYNITTFGVGTVTVIFSACGKLSGTTFEVTSENVNCPGILKEEESLSKLTWKLA